VHEIVAVGDAVKDVVDEPLLVGERHGAIAEMGGLAGFDHERSPTPLGSGGTIVQAVPRCHAAIGCTIGAPHPPEDGWPMEDGGIVIGGAAGGLGTRDQGPCLRMEAVSAT